MFKQTHYILFGALFAGSSAFAAEEPKIVEHNMLMDHGDGHMMDMDGAMVMGQNTDKLPPGCSKVSEDVAITVRAAHKYAKDYPGTMFGFDKHEWKVKPCTRLTVHFINEDNVRHQWMMHGLPKFMYDKGMFHLEVTGPGKVSGTLILPPDDKTYLVHCDIAQHMEKGMKGQLIVGKGGATFPTIPGITDPAFPDNYGPVTAAPAATTAPVPGSVGPAPSSAAQTPTKKPSSGPFVLGVVLGALGTPFVAANLRQRFKGMSAEEIVAYLVETGQRFIDSAIGWVNAIYRNIRKS